MKSNISLKCDANACSNGVDYGTATVKSFHELITVGPTVMSSWKDPGCLEIL